MADSESSTVRCVSLKDGSVKAVVGGAIDPLVSPYIISLQSQCYKQVVAHYDMHAGICRTCLHMVMLMEKVEKLDCSILWAWLGVRGMSWSMLLTPTTTRQVYC